MHVELKRRAMMVQPHRRNTLFALGHRVFQEVINVSLGLAGIAVAARVE
jgi:hypothetical protein